MPSTQYRVYLTPFPFGSDSATLRPVIALTNPLLPTSQVLCAPILSSVLASSKCHIPLLENLDFMGLKTKSTALLDSLVSLPVSGLYREIGYVPKFIRSNIEEEIASIFGL